MAKAITDYPFISSLVFLQLGVFSATTASNGRRARRWSVVSWNPIFCSMTKYALEQTTGTQNTGERYFDKLSRRGVARLTWKAQCVTAAHGDCFLERVALAITKPIFNSYTRHHKSSMTLNYNCVQTYTVCGKICLCTKKWLKITRQSLTILKFWNEILHIYYLFICM